MSKNNPVVTVPTYYVGLQYVLGHGPFDKIDAIYVDERLVWKETPDEVEPEVAVDGSIITIDKPDLFGGLSREGGVTGKMEFLFGRVTQGINSYIQDKLRKGGVTPAFRGVVTALARHMYVGTNYYLKPWAFVATRIHVRQHGEPQWQDSISEIPSPSKLTKNSIISLTHDGTTAILQLKSTLDLVAGTQVIIAGASYAAYNGTFTLTSVNQTTKKARYTMGSTPGGDSTVTSLTLLYQTKGLMNGVHMIRDCLTDKSWGLGVPESLIDETTFLAAAQQCYNEGLGFAFYWAEERPIDELIQQIKQHIQASVYINRVTGKYEIKLTRYVEDSTGLLTLNDTNTREVTNFKRKSLGELVNQVTVKFLNNATLKDDSYTVSDSSLMQRQGGVVSKTFTYDGVADTQTAQKLAARDLHQLSVPIYTCSIKCNRDAENLNEGDPFILYRPDLVDANLIMRVVKISLGTIEKGEITIEAAQDMFHAASVVYDVPDGTAWSDPISDPIPVVLRLINEVPYYLVALDQGDTFAQAVTDTTAYLAIAAVAPASTAYSAGIWTGPTSSVNDLSRYGAMDFCFSALLGNNLDKVQTTLNLTDIVGGVYPTVGNFIQVGTELMSVSATTETTITVIRGVLDTVPVTHTIGERIWAWQDFSGSDKIAYATSETTYVFLSTITPKGELAVATAPDNITFAGRMHMPYPPGNLKLGGSYWPTSVATGALTFTWAHRNRIQQTAGLIGYYTTDVTTEASVTYSWELRRTDTNAILDSGTGLTANTLTTATLTYTGQVRFRIWSVRGGFTSFQTVEHIFYLT